MFLPAAAAFLLTGGALDGLYSPWSLAVVSAAGVGWPGLAPCWAPDWALFFSGFSGGAAPYRRRHPHFLRRHRLLHHPLYRRPRFRPAAAVVMTLLVQSAYLFQRQPRQWTLCAAALAILWAGAVLLPALTDSTAGGETRQQAWFLLALGVCLSAYGWGVSGFRVGGLLAAALLLTAARRLPCRRCRCRSRDRSCAGSLHRRNGAADRRALRRCRRGSGSAETWAASAAAGVLRRGRRRVPSAGRAGPAAAALPEHRRGGPVSAAAGASAAPAGAARRQHRPERSRSGGGGDARCRVPCRVRQLFHRYHAAPSGESRRAV